MRIASVIPSAARKLLSLVVIFPLLVTCGKDGPTDADLSDGQVAQVAIVTQPASSVVAGAPFTVAVAVQNSRGETVNAIATVTVSLSPLGGATLGGTRTKTALNGVATFTDLTIDKVGTVFLNATTPGVGVGVSTNSFSVTAGAPAKLVASAVPNSVTSMAAMPAIQVSVQDAGGNVVTAGSTSITMTLTGGAGSAILGGTVGKTTIDGVATFNDLTVDKAGTGYALTPSAVGLAGVASTAFTVTSGPATKLAFAVQPTGAVAGAAINPAVEVVLQDAAGNIALNNSTPITVAIAPATGAGGATLGGSKTENSFGSTGVASFGTLTIDKAAANYALIATAPSLTSVTSATFAVTPGIASKLGWVVQPTATVAGASISPAIQVAVQDALGNTISNATNAITLTILAGSGAVGSTLTGTLTQNAVAGIATFNNLKLDKAASNYSLSATATGFSNNSFSSAFAITFGAASQVGLTTNAAGAPSGAAFTTKPVAAVLDANGNTVTSDNGSVITMTVSAGATVVGTATATTTAGVATFATAGLSGVADSTYTLTFSRGGLTAATQTITVTPGVATQLVMITNAAGAANGSAFSTQPVVGVKDASGNLVKNDISSVITMTASAGATTVGTTTALVGVGIATFSGTGIGGLAGTYTLTFSRAGLTSATQNITLTAGAATQLVLQTSAAGGANGLPFTTQPVVMIKDAAGNTVTGDNSSVVSVSVNAGGTVSGANSATASTGVATFSGMGITGSAGTAYTLTYARSGLTSVTQTATLVNGATDFAGVWSGNVTTNNAEVPTMAMVLNLAAGGGTITGTSTLGDVAIANVAITDGTLSFSFPNFQQGDPDCNSWNLTGSGTLNAARTIMTLAISGTICGATPGISGSGPLNKIGPATQLAVKTEAAGASSGLAFTTQPAVEVRDAANRRVPTDNGSVVTMTVSGNGTVIGTATATTVAGVATFTNVGVTGIHNNAYTLTFSKSGVGPTSQGIVVTYGLASQLAFYTHPSNSTVGGPISPAIEVVARDSRGNAVLNATPSITVALLSNATGAVLGGSTTITAANGGASFSTLTLDKPGQGYTLQATASGLASATSNTFNIVGPATNISFTAQPTSGIRNGVISPSVVVTVKDAAGNVVNSGGNVTIAIGTNAGGATLSGTLTKGVSSGLATFNNLSLNAGGIGYTLSATTTLNGVPGATSATFDMAAFGAAAKLAIVAQPSNADVGVVMSPAVQVAIQDAIGNIVTSSTASVTLAYGANPSAGTLGGTVTTAAVGGIATFSNLTGSAAGNNYTITASATSLSSATSTAFNVVTPGSAVKLGFVQQPTSTTAGSTLIPALTVAVQNSSGATITSDNSTVVSLALVSAPVGGTLRGTKTATAVNGIATFSALNDTVSGTYVIGANAPGLTSAASASYSITAGVASKLAFVQQPTAVRAGDLFSQPVRVGVTDVYGNVVLSASNTITLSASNGIGYCNCTFEWLSSISSIDGVLKNNQYQTGTSHYAGTLTAAAVNGIATFADIRPRWVQSDFLKANAAGMAQISSVQYTITPSVPTQVWVSVPAVHCGGTIWCGVKDTVNYAVPVFALILDSLSNATFAGTDIVSLAFGSNPSGAVLSTANNVSAVNGRANFSISVDKAGNAYTLVASIGGLSSTSSVPFDVLAFGTASRLSFTVQPTNSSAGVAIAPSVKVCVQDGVGNTVTTATNNITIAIANNPGATTLGGTATVAAISGCATFSNLTLGAPGSSYTLVATASGLLQATSLGFNISP